MLLYNIIKQRYLIMASKITIQNSPLKIFGDEKQVLQASKALLRLSQLDQFLSEDVIEGREENAMLLSKVWENAKENLSMPFEEAKKKLQGEFNFFSPVLIEYSAQGLAVQGRIQLEKFLDRNLNDLTSVQIAPIKKSHRGNKGPTLLVSYPKYRSNGSEKRVEFVIKWTQWSEILCNRIYEFFLRAVKKTSKERYEISVPRASGLDFEARLYQKKTGEFQILSDTAAQELYHNFLRTSQIYTSKKIEDNQQLMISDRVRGENLFDFAKSKYEFLRLDQKKSIFRSLATIAFLDLLMGNLDRMIQVHFSNTKQEYCLEDFEANFGNVMISWSVQSNENPILFAIDNGIDEVLINNSTYQEKYIEFLKNLFNTSQFEKILAKNMIGSFINTLSTQVDDEGENVLEVKKQLAVYSGDLDKFVFEVFVEGFLWMSEELRQNLIPSWLSNDQSLTNEHLFPLHAQIHQAINKRFKVLQDSRIKS
jgi:hypothetical protein